MSNMADELIEESKIPKDSTATLLKLLANRNKKIRNTGVPITHKPRISPNQKLVSTAFEFHDSGKDYDLDITAEIYVQRYSDKSYIVRLMGKVSVGLFRPEPFTHEFHAKKFSVIEPELNLAYKTLGELIMNSAVRSRAKKTARILLKVAVRLLDKPDSTHGLKLVVKLLTSAAEAAHQQALADAISNYEHDKETKSAVIKIWHDIEKLIWQERRRGLDQSALSEIKDVLKRDLDYWIGRNSGVELEGADNKAIIEKIVQYMLPKLPGIAKPIIRELVKTRPVTRNSKSRILPPKTFPAFRKQLAKAVSKYDSILARSIGDTDYEGDVAAKLFHSFWEPYEYEVKQAKTPKERLETFLAQIDGSLEDALHDTIVEYSNPWNYGPGETPKKRLRPAHIPMIIEDFSKPYELGYSR